MIPINLLIKYQMAFEGETTEEVKERYGDEFYSVFLIQTDHIPNKIIESLIENLADATALNFIKVFIQSLADVRVRYSEILKLRKQAREEINRLEGKTVPEPTGTTEEVTV